MHRNISSLLLYCSIGEREINKKFTILVFLYYHSTHLALSKIVLAPTSKLFYLPFNLLLIKAWPGNSYCSLPWGQRETAMECLLVLFTQGFKSCHKLHGFPKLYSDKLAIRVAISFKGFHNHTFISFCARKSLLSPVGAQRFIPLLHLFVCLFWVYIIVSTKIFVHSKDERWGVACRWGRSMQRTA